MFFEQKVAGVVIPKPVKLVTLDKNGYMKGVDLMPLTRGHFDPSAPKGLLPFDQEMADFKLRPAEDIQAAVQKQLAKEAGQTTAMLLALNIKHEDSPAVQCMLNARRRVAWIYQNDSHLETLTKDLPPTASMPEAAFSPAEIYKPFGEGV